MNQTSGNILSLPYKRNSSRSLTALGLCLSLVVLGALPAAALPTCQVFPSSKDTGCCCAGSDALEDAAFTMSSCCRPVSHPEGDVPPTGQLRLESAHAQAPICLNSSDCACSGHVGPSGDPGAVLPTTDSSHEADALSPPTSGIHRDNIDDPSNGGRLVGIGRAAEERLTTPLYTLISSLLC